MDCKMLEKAINKIMVENAVYGKLYKGLVIEDKVARLTCEKDIRNLKEYREYFLEPRIPFYSKWFMSNEVKNTSEFESKNLELREKERKIADRHVPSGYAFACFSSFEAVTKFKKYSKK